MKALEGWNKIVLDSVISVIQSGSRPKGGASSDRGDIPSLGGENIITGGGVTLSDVKLVPFDFYNRMTKGHLQHGDVLINKDGAQTGKVGYYQAPSNPPSCINEHLFLLRGKVEQIEQKYLYYTLLSQSGQNQIRTQISGSAQPGLKSGFTQGIVADLPDLLPEQTKIAEILSTVDRAIEQTEALIAKQQRIKTGLMQDLLTRGIDEQGNIRSEQTHQFKDSPLGRIPVEWKVGGFDNYVVNDAGIKPGPFGSSLTKAMYVQSGYRVYGQEQVIGGTLELGDYYITERRFTEMAAFSVREGDVLISLVGTIGHVLIIPKGHHPGVINPRLLRFRPDPMHCLPDFLRVLLLSQPIRLQLDTFATGGTMPVLSAGIIRKLCVVVIGRAEQERILQTLGRSENCILSTSNRLTKLRSLKTALMQDLLTGKKRVTPLLNDTEVIS